MDIKLKTTAAAQGAFGYDGAGRRQERTIGATATGYLHDGINPVQEQQGATTNNVFAGGTDTFFSRVDANGNRTYLRDRLAGATGLVDSAGTVQTSYTYEPFGRGSATGQASTNPYQFTGRENDGLGLMYYRARYYSPVLHRFVSEDPIGFGGGINRYSYVMNNPVGAVDPNGLHTKCFPQVFSNDYGILIILLNSCAAQSYGDLTSLLGVVLGGLACSPSVNGAIICSGVGGALGRWPKDFDNFTGNQGICFGALPGVPAYFPIPGGWSICHPRPVPPDGGGGGGGFGCAELGAVRGGPPHCRPGGGRGGGAEFSWHGRK